MIITIGHLLLSRDVSPPTLVVPPLVAICLLILITDLYAAGEYGIWQGLVARKSTQALTKTVLYVLVFPQVSLPVVAGADAGQKYHLHQLRSRSIAAALSRRRDRTVCNGGSE